jgi:hypothetical protein
MSQKTSSGVVNHTNSLTCLAPLQVTYLNQQSSQLLDDASWRSPNDIFTLTEHCRPPGMTKQVRVAKAWCLNTYDLFSQTCFCLCYGNGSSRGEPQGNLLRRFGVDTTSKSVWPAPYLKNCGTTVKSLQPSLRLGYCMQQHTASL